MCEDVRKHRDVRLVRTEKKAKKLVAKPQYLQHIVYNESFAAIQLKKTVVKLDKPRYFNFNPLKIQKNPSLAWIGTIPLHIRAQLRSPIN